MKVALGVSGGIAAYKAAELLRMMQEKELRVQVIMTRAAQEFVRPLTFAALSGEKVITEIFGAGAAEPNIESAVEHIAVAQSIDALVVAPATADIIAKFAHGIASDFLSTLFLATTAPVILAPAMNVNMWEHPATQENIKKLAARGTLIVEPDSGYLACGMIGAGRLAANETIVQAVMQALGAIQDLAGETLLITAGPTREPIDPVRYIGNRSSGRMGYALAEAALRRGAKVILISGPTALKPPAGAEVVTVQTAKEMRDAVMTHLDRATAVIKAAAVADFTVHNAADQKIKRTGAMTLELVPTADILKEIAARKGSRLVIGFAAETQNTLENARKKLQSKSLDAIVANDVSRPGTGFDSERNAVTIITRDNLVEVPETSKAEVAQRVLDTLVQLKSASARALSHE
ncbi:MAG TPA: bifunctional phosphopantothenoylcysteine decarboxylase/phosphopantothenate--cysteine ligase CoaBC [Candidatus Saccharimonadales bacterium]|jgi:phosphopantothenoylcysteine decarboxylase/phosphopantothenate--cysteine ligase|nr:bifunctional phosphopantothenoylcysteine decarboxylase/phosphopantothenate--cysteine ligase CoaBC [Candidatus Saccharimonadales bacterium]